MSKYKRLKKGIIKSIEKFNLNLSERVVLTEAATGNYVVTPIIAAVAGAKKVYAFTKNSEYGSIEEVRRQTYTLAEMLDVKKRILIVTSFEEIDFSDVDIVTNTGFLRPLNKNLIDKLSPKCVISLMYEPWEFRKGEIDLETCYEKGIKVYGINESDERLRTMEYIGFIVLYFLLDNKYSPFSSNVLLVGCEKFVAPVFKILTKNGYEVESITDYNIPLYSIDHDVIVILEHQRNILIIGEKEKAFIDKEKIDENNLVIHICGNVDFENVKFRYVPQKIKPFGYMSITTDFIDPQAVIDLHTAGLKVAEGMLKANELGLKGLEYKLFMEKNYPALAFEDVKLW